METFKSKTSFTQTRRCLLNVLIPKNIFVKKTKKMKINIIIFFISVIGITRSYSQISKPSESNPNHFTIGDNPPALHIIKWVKGKPIQEFKKNHVYIIEFGFVFCAPCRSSIPHLTAIQKKYPKEVTVINIFTNESNSEDTTDLTYITRIENLVKNQKNKMNFSVAVDVPQQTTKSIWMKAAGQNSYPTVFVIDQLGKLAWIGNTLELDSIIVQVVDGKFNAQSTANIQREKEKLLALSLDEVFKEKNNGDTAAAFAGIDNLIKTYPDVQYLYFKKFEILSGANDTKAFAFVKWMLENLRNFDWFHFSYLVTGTINLDYFDIGISVIDRAIEMAETKELAAYAMEIKAWDYCFRKGDIRKAIEIQQKAIETYRLEIKQLGDADLEERLKQYKQKLAELK